MATSRDYATNLIGSYDTSYLNKQRDAKQASFQTGWEALQNQYRNLVDSLETTRKRNEEAYNAGLTGVAEDSLSNIRAGMSNLVGRGLTGSGLVNKVQQADIATKGKAVGGLLDKLNTNTTGNIDKLVSANSTLASGSSNLGEKLTSGLSGIGDADLNAQNNLMEAISSIASSKDSRDASNSLSGASSKAQSDADAQEQETAKRKLLTALAYDLDPETMRKDEDAVNYAQALQDAKTPAEIKKVKTAWEESNRQKVLAANLLGGADVGSFSALLKGLAGNEIYDTADYISSKNVLNKNLDKYNKKVTKYSNAANNKGYSQELRDRNLNALMNLATPTNKYIDVGGDTGYTGSTTQQLQDLINNLLNR